MHVKQGTLIARRLFATSCKAVSSRPTLHEELQDILLAHGNRWMTTRELAAEVNARDRYRKRDGSTVVAFQVYGRARQYASMFNRDGLRIRLKT